MTSQWSSHPVGDATLPREREGLRVRPLAITWDFAAFEVSDGIHELVGAIPRRLIERFLALLDRGVLDGLLRNAVTSRLVDRVLASRGQTEAPGLFGTILLSSALLPRDRSGVGDGAFATMAVGKIPLSVLMPRASAALITTAASASHSGSATPALATGAAEVEPPSLDREDVQGAATVVLAEVENPGSETLVVRGQTLIGLSDDEGPTVLARPFEVEVAARSNVFLGLALSSDDDVALAAAPAVIETDGETQGHVFRLILNLASQRARLNAVMVMNRTQSLGPSRPPSLRTPLATIDLPAGQSVQLGLGFDTDIAVRDGSESESLRVVLGSGRWRSINDDNESDDDVRHDELDDDDSGATGDLGDVGDHHAGEAPRPQLFTIARLDAADLVQLAGLETAIGTGHSVSISTTDESPPPLPQSAAEWHIIGDSQSFSYQWPDGAGTIEMSAMPNVWLAPGEPADVTAYRQTRSSISRAEDAPIRSTARVQRSSIPREEDGPLVGAAVADTTDWSALLRSPAAIISLLVIAGVVAVASLLFLGGGDEQAASPASDGAASANGTDSGTTAGGADTTGGGGDTTAGGGDAGSGDTSSVPVADPIVDNFEVIANLLAVNGVPASHVFQQTYDDSGRPVTDAPVVPWTKDVRMQLVIDDKQLVWVEIEGPTDLLQSACGEVDVIIGRGEHVGTGMDFCPSEAEAPFYFTDIVRYDVNEPGDRMRLLIMAAQELVEPDARVSLWLMLVGEDGGYQASEHVGQGIALAPVDFGDLSGGDATVLTGPSDLESPAPQLAVPSIGGVLGTSGGADPVPVPPEFIGVIAPGFYAVTFHGIRDGTCGRLPEYTTNMSLEVGISPADDGWHELTFFDGQTRATGLIDVSTGQFEGVGDQYSGTLVGDFSTSQVIIRTLQLPDCTAKYFISVTAQ
jgi:hypothetical protein